MKEKFQRFMIGRYGNDEFGRFLLGLTALLLILSLFIRSSLTELLLCFLIVYMYFRMFSKNIAKRRQENQVYLKYQNQALRFMDKQKRIAKERKVNHIYSCPNCKQMIRVPKGKGKIAITCPKCKTEFIKKS